jgi:hypothetical protein
MILYSVICRRCSECCFDTPVQPVCIIYVAIVIFLTKESAIERWFFQ